MIRDIAQAAAPPVWRPVRGRTRATDEGRRSGGAAGVPLGPIAAGLSQ